MSFQVLCGISHLGNRGETPRTYVSTGSALSLPERPAEVLPDRGGAREAEGAPSSRRIGVSAILLPSHAR